MKRRFFVVLTILFVLLLSSCSETEDIYNVDLSSVDSLGNFSFGYLLAQDSMAQRIIPNGAYFAKGVYDSSKGDSPWFDYEAMNAILQDYQAEYFYTLTLGEAGKEYKSSKAINKLTKPTDLQNQFSYVWGFANSPDVYTDSHCVDVDAFIAGFFSALYEKDVDMTREEMEEAFALWQDNINALYEEEYIAAADANSKAASEFLEENKTKEGIVVLESGVQLKIVKEVSDGVSPVKGDEVVVDYQLSLLDGSIVDSGEGVTFSTDSLIAGFVDAVINMKVGESVTAYIPPEMGYGDADLGVIGPNSLLIFDISLKDIREK